MMNKTIKLFLLITCFFLLFSLNNVSAYALTGIPIDDTYDNSSDNENNTYSDYTNNKQVTVLAERINQEHSSFIDIQITITNNDEDFDGTARLNLHTYRNGTHAYDTAISLPANSTKQFIITIPASYINTFSNDNSNYISFHLINKKNKAFFSKRLPNSILAEPNVLNVGILSNSFDSLSYLSLAGNTIEYNNRQYAIKLCKLDQKNLDDSLYQMQIILIDNYNMKDSDIDVSALRDWINSGNCLFVGTGSYAKKVLSKDMDFYFGISVDPKNNYDSLDYFYVEDELIDSNSAFYYLSSDRYFLQTSTYLNGVNKDIGQGTIAVFPFSFSDVIDQSFISDNAISDYAYNMAADLYNTFYFNNSNISRHYLYGSNSTDSISYYADRYFAAIEKFSNNFSLLRMTFIIIIYLIIISPLLYFVLKKIKKQEFYWIAIPCLSLLFVIIIYFAGLGFNVSKIVIHSISSIDSTGAKEPINYFNAYASSKKEYSIKLANNCTAAAYIDNSYLRSFNDDYSYNDLITKNNTDYSAIVRPEMSFEGKLGKTTSQNIDTGNFELIDKKTITNNTGYDFDYVLVYENNSLSIYKGINNQESIDTNSRPIIMNKPNSTGDPIQINAISSKIENYYSYYRDREACCYFNALCFTVSELLQEDSSIRYVAIGITNDINPVASTSGTKETNYSCIYTVFN